MDFFFFFFFFNMEREILELTFVNTNYNNNCAEGAPVQCEKFCECN